MLGTFMYTQVYVYIYICIYDVRKVLATCMDLLGFIWSKVVRRIQDQYKKGTVRMRG